MRLGLVYFITLILTALALAPAAAALLQLHGHMSLSDQDYIFVQKMGEGWAWTWIFAPMAMVADVILVFLFNREPVSKLVSLAALLMACTFLIDAAWIYPVEQVTAGWMVLPDNWTVLRTEWEYAQATNALLMFMSFCALALAAPVMQPPYRRRAGYRMGIWYVR